MSHITAIETKVKDLASLKAACARLGFEFVEGKTAYEWYGRYVGDSQVPDGMTIEDYGKCDHAIRCPGAKYEVGVVKVGREYQLRFDSYHVGGLMEHLGNEKAGRLVQAYAIEKAKREATRLGRRIVGEQTLEDGSIRLQLQGGSR